MKINQAELLKFYMQRVDDICYHCDWVTSFSPTDIVRIISDILEKNEHLIDQTK